MIFLIMIQSHTINLIARHIAIAEYARHAPLSAAVGLVLVALEANGKSIAVADTSASNRQAI